MINLGVVLSFLFISSPLGAQLTLSPEYQSKANLVSKFTLFIELSEDALPPGQAPFLICVFLHFTFRNSLTEKTRGTTAQDRRVVGETTGFLDVGGIANVAMQREMLQFEGNLPEACKVHLDISSQTPALARRVINKIEAAKT